MYLPTHFREDRLEVQHALIEANPLGLLIVASLDGLVADPVPFLLAPSEGEFGILRAHISRANPQAAALADVKECLVAFQASEAYISPSWYATKRETGKVVPTWNYAVVHAWGMPRLIEDTSWLRTQIDGLTALQEGSRPQPWKVDDAPEPFVAAQIRGIIGIEIPIARIEGKWKVSQNRSEADRAGVAEGLREAGDPMADLVYS
ncbi:FMN-binding negative transcriptional regulator [soil metagenome]